MLTRLDLHNFKSWSHLDNMPLKPITGLFGPNSSGKTSILQFLLALKQTVESIDRSRVLYLGDDRTYVDLGTFADAIHDHRSPGDLTFGFEWKLSKPLRIQDPEGGPKSTLFKADAMAFQATIAGDQSGIFVKEFVYTPHVDESRYRFGMSRQQNENNDKSKISYTLVTKGYEAKRTRGRAWALPMPVKFYGFPDQVNAYYQNVGFLSELVLSLEEMFQNIYYLGPLREYPHRTYVWAGERPRDVGQRGELAVPALLAADKQGKKIGRGRGRPKQTLSERVAEWLRDLGLIHSFDVRPIAPNRKEYEVRVRQSPDAAEVSITDVGFGVSQILPVLTLCYYAPKNATLILEQPEIHLHPSVQAGLADVFIDAIRTRNIQIILESHSEHLLRRLQRRIAEEKLSSDQAALYFVSMAGSSSRLEPLALDPYGNITNWPENFFGDEMGDLIAMTEAAMARQRKDE